MKLICHMWSMVLRKFRTEIKFMLLIINWNKKIVHIMWYNMIWWQARLRKILQISYGLYQNWYFSFKSAIFSQWMTGEHPILCIGLPASIDYFGKSGLLINIFLYRGSKMLNSVICSETWERLETKSLTAILPSFHWLRFSNGSSVSMTYAVAMTSAVALSTTAFCDIALCSHM